MEGRILLNASVTAPHDCNTNTCFRFVVRLLPVILTAPLLGACMGGLAPRPGAVEVIWMGQPPPYGVPGFGPVPMGAPTAGRRARRQTIETRFGRPHRYRASLKMTATRRHRYRARLLSPGRRVRRENRLHA